MKKNKIVDNKIFQRVIKNIKALLQMTNRNEKGLNEKLCNETDIFDELGIDSVEIMDLLGILETEFETTFNIDKFGHRKTIGDIVEFIANQLLEQNG